MSEPTTPAPMPPQRPTPDPDPALVQQLQGLGERWSPLGVALVAAALTDRRELLYRLHRDTPTPTPLDFWTCRGGVPWHRTMDPADGCPIGCDGFECREQDKPETAQERGTAAVTFSNCTFEQSVTIGADAEPPSPLRQACSDAVNTGRDVLASAGLLDLVERPAHRPMRDDEVATWLKRHRDLFDRIDDVDEWSALDQILDLYRLHADTGTPLDQEPSEGGHDE